MRYCPCKLVVDIHVPPSDRGGLQMIVVKATPSMLSSVVLVTVGGTVWVWTPTCVPTLWVWCVVGTIYVWVSVITGTLLPWVTFILGTNAFLVWTVTTRVENVLKEDFFLLPSLPLVSPLRKLSDVSLPWLKRCDCC